MQSYRKTHSNKDKKHKHKPKKDKFGYNTYSTMAKHIKMRKLDELEDNEC